MYPSREERDRIRHRKMERKITEACIRRDYDAIKHWIACGYVDRDYVKMIFKRVEKGWLGDCHHWGNPRPIRKSNGMSNPCSEIPLTEKQKCVLSHPTARVNRKLLLIG